MAWLVALDHIRMTIRHTLATMSTTSGRGTSSTSPAASLTIVSARMVRCTAKRPLMTSKWPLMTTRSSARSFPTNYTRRTFASWKRKWRWLKLSSITRVRLLNQRLLKQRHTTGVTTSKRGLMSFRWSLKEWSSHPRSSCLTTSVKKSSRLALRSTAKSWRVKTSSCTKKN